MAGPGHALGHRPAAALRTEDGKIFVLLIFVLGWLMVMMSLPIWLPALVSSLAE